jgi:formylglycine-generating enzyme required for sulfatase activity
MFQLTFAEYDKYCDIANIEKPKDKGWGRGRRPAINVSWDDATAYVNWLNVFLGAKYALPNEKNWYLACNNGAKTKWHFGDKEEELKNYAWYSENSGGMTQPVGEKKSNVFGLYDMHGNIFEWSEEWDKGDKTSKMLFGGSWINSAEKTSYFSYSRDTPNYQVYDIGFRLQRTLLS